MNGQTLGVYLEIEGVDKRFFQKRGIAVQSLFYASNDYADFGLLKPGTHIRKSSLFSGYERIIGGSRDVEQWKLLAFPTIRRQYKQLLGRLLLRQFTVRRLDPAIRRMSGAIAPYIHSDGSRQWSRAEFDGEPRVIRTYIRERRRQVRAELRDL